MTLGNMTLRTNITPRTLYDRGFALLVAAGVSMVLAAPASAQAVPSGEEPDAAEAAAPDAGDADNKDADIKNLELDWSLLNVDASTLTTGPASKARPALRADTGADLSWSSTDAPPSQSSGTAWATITAPGVASIWDKTAVEARVDPSQEQSKLGTSLSKSLPLNEQYSLTLQNGYNVVEQGHSSLSCADCVHLSAVPVRGIAGRPVRNYGTEQSAKPRRGRRTRASPRDSSAVGRRRVQPVTVAKSGERSMPCRILAAMRSKSAVQMGAVKLVVRGDNRARATRNRGINDERHSSGQD